MESRQQYDQRRQGGGKPHYHHNPEGNQEERKYNKGYNNQGYKYSGNFRDQNKNYQGGNKNFHNKPQGGGQFQGKQFNQLSLQRRRGEESQVNVVTNQYRMKMANSVTVFCYQLQVDPEVVQDTHLRYKIIKTVSKKLEMVLGQYVMGGCNIFTYAELEESLVIKTQYRDLDYTIFVDHTTKSSFNSQTFSRMKMEQHDVSHTLLNLVIKEALRQTNLKQIGKNPRFFDTEKAVFLEGSGLQMWPGFKATSFNYETGLALVIDNVYKFMSTTSVLDRIMDLYKQNQQMGQENFQKMVQREFRGKSVIATWGGKRAYIVRDIMFNSSPATMRFTDGDGENITILDYFMKVYNMRITQKNQPLIETKIGQKVVHLPTEFCTIDGVPETIRSDPFKMRGVIGNTKKTPDEKLNEIQEFSEKLFAQKAFKEWGIEVEERPIAMDTRVLALPEVLDEKGRQVMVESNTLRNLPVHNPMKLKKDTWVIVYGKKRQYDNANCLYETMAEASAKLQILVEEPVWLELEHEQAVDQFEAYIEKLKTSKESKPFIFVIILEGEHLYNQYKNICYRNNIVSQVVSSKTCRRMNMSVATNILKQMNSKVGGELYLMDIPQEVSKRTMLIGIDVCHSGPNSIVGFCATINEELSKYFSYRIVQARGQEIITKKLKTAIENAILSFRKHHKRELPDHFIIYRDGVGDAMRQQVLDTEISQLHEVINQLYNKLSRPSLTVIIVNKRISQRFFVESRGQLLNPPSGCVVDTKMVENQSNSKAYDFFLIPQQTTQGCVLPTHFYVAFNDSKLDKIVVENLTFALCHYYFNWAGPIKVPAPCMYAHKIAELFMNIKEIESNKQYMKQMAKQNGQKEVPKPNPPQEPQYDKEGNVIMNKEAKQDDYQLFSHNLSFKVCESFHYL